MGWCVHVSLERDRPLTRDERAALVAHVHAWNREPWEMEAYDLWLPRRALANRTLAHGTIKLAHDADHPDLARLLAALGELRELIADTTCAVADDLAIVAWSAGRGYTLEDAASQPEVVAPPRSKQWASARSLPAPRRRSAAVVAPAIPDGPNADALRALAEIPRTRELDSRRCTALATRVAAAPDRAALHAPVLALWRSSPTEALFVNLTYVLRGVATEPVLVDEWIASVQRATDPHELERVSAAVSLLKHGGLERGLAALLAVMRRYRETPAAFPPAQPGVLVPASQRIIMAAAHWNTDALAAGPAAAFALLLASPASDYIAVRGLRRFAGGDTLAYFDRIPARWPHADVLFSDLETLCRDGLIDIATFEHRCRGELTHPFAKVRYAAAAALEHRLGESARPALAGALLAFWHEGLWETRNDFESSATRLLGEPRGTRRLPDAFATHAIAAETTAPFDDPLDDLMSQHWQWRQQGISRIRRRHRDDPRYLFPLMLYESMLAEMPFASGYVSWSDFPTLPAELRRHAQRDERARWIRANVAADALALPETLRDIVRLGPKLVALRYPPIGPAAFELPDELRSRLAADEAAFLATHLA